MDISEPALLFLIASVISLFLPTIAYILCSIGSLLFLFLGFKIFSGANIGQYYFKINDYLHLTFGIDNISAFFIIVISILSIAVSIYSIDYTKHLKNARVFTFLYSLFVFSIYGVVISTNIFAFLVFWEGMSILSYFLVAFENNPASSKAGLIYAIMTHIGTAFIITSFLILSYWTNSMDLVTFKALSYKIPNNIKGLIFVFALVGFGFKAGIMPFHYWLPIAHPSAPSNISALMSGVMIKTGVYGIIRVCYEILGQGSDWWGILILSLGALSAILAIMQAVMEKDIKRLLAYSSIENIGIIFLGLGASMLFANYNMKTLSAISLLACFYHILNHSIFKGLLFMSAGSVLHSTGTKNMEKLGGLIKKMPKTALFFLIGSISICALPPFNGFVSEWILYQSLISGFYAPSNFVKIMTPLFASSLALTGAIAGTAFVKAFGISFLGKPRNSSADNAQESTLTMTVSMCFLAVLCLLLGIFPNIVISILTFPIFSLTGTLVDSFTKGPFIMVSGSVSTPLIALTLIMFILMAVMFIRVFFGRKNVEFKESWDCGILSLNSRMQYTGTAFTKPLKIIFKQVYMPRREVKINYSVDKLFVSSMKYSGDIAPFFRHYILEPLFRWINNFAEKIKLLQSGGLHLYLAYILFTLVVLLIFGL